MSKCPIDLDGKMDKIVDLSNEQNIRLTRIETIIERNADVLKEHQRRSIANEKRVETVEKSLISVQCSIDSHLQFIKGSIKLFGGLLGLISISLGILKTLQSLGLL